MTLALVAIDGRTFAIRADRIEKTVAIKGASRMSQHRGDIVAAVVDDEVRFFSDLAVLVGHEPAVGSSGAGLVLEGAGRIAGIAVADAPQQIGFEDHRVLPIAESYGHDVFDACAFFADQSIPVLSDAFLSRLADDAAVEATDVPRTLALADTVGPADHLTRVAVGGGSYAVASEQPLVPAEPAPAVVGLPGSPDSIAGVAAHEGTMVPVIDLARRLETGSTATGRTAAACAARGSTVLLLVDEIAGEVPAAPEPIELSPLLAGPSFHEAVVVEHEPLPLIRAEALLADVRPPADSAEPSFAFADELLHSDVRVVELALEQSVYAVPEAETVDAPDDLRRTSFPVHHPLASGAYTTGDRLVPEIDLASYLGHEGGAAPGTDPIVIQSGGVQAILRPTRVDGTKLVSRDDQRPLPIRPAHDVVYGCYVDGDDVRLILNLGAIARHGRDPAVQTALAGLAGRADGARDREDQGATAPAAAATSPAPPANEPPAPADAAAPADSAPAPTPDTAAPADPAGAPGTPAGDATEPAPTSGTDEEHGDYAARAGAADHAGEARRATAAPPPDEPRPTPDGPKATPDTRRGADDGPRDEPPAGGVPHADSTADSTADTDAGPTDAAAAATAAPDGGGVVAAQAHAGEDSAAPPRPSPTGPDAPRRRARRGRVLLAALLLLLAAGAFAAFVYPGAERIASLLPAGAGASDPRDTQAQADGDAELPAGGGDETSVTEQPDARSGSDDAPNRSEAARTDPASPGSRADADGTWDEVVYFTPDSALLLPRARRTLDSLVRTLPQDEAWTLEVVGHTARVGTAETSQALSEERARTVADYVLQRLDPDPRSVVVRGMGARDPAASNATPEGRELNRRAEIFARER